MITLKLGSRGPDVTMWQHILAAIRHPPSDISIAIDGVFGPKTEEATKEWQRARGLEPDGVVGPKTWGAALSPSGPDGPKMLRGLDLSSNQGIVDFAPLVGLYDFAILRAQIGNDGFDPDFARNAEEAFDHGIEPFPYGFAYILPPSLLSPSRDPKRQAQMFVERVLKTAPKMEGRPFFNDYEWPEVVARPPLVTKGWREWGCSPPMIATWMRDHTAEVKRLSKRKTVSYIYDWWWSCVRDGAPTYGFPEKGDVSFAEDTDLWIAWYRDGWPIRGQSPKIPSPFKGWLFWQFDGNGGLHLPNGVDADFCVFHGDKEALQSFIQGDVQKAEEAEVTSAS